MSFEIEMSKFKRTLDIYCKERKEGVKVVERASELLNEMKVKNKASLLSWLIGEGKTLLLQSNLRETTYCGNLGDNTTNTLNDFNAFALLDTVSIYNKRNWVL